MGKEEQGEVLTVAGRDVRITHPNKPYFSRQVQLSKLDIVQYYLSVAPGALAGIRDRPIVLKRFVDGAESEPFYQKRAPSDRPSWLRTVTLSFPSGRTAAELVVDDAAGLAWIAAGPSDTVRLANSLPVTVPVRRIFSCKSRID